MKTEMDEKKSVYFEGFTGEQKKYIMDNFVFFLNGDKFRITAVGPNPYGCFISLNKSDGSFKGAYCVDIMTDNRDINVKVRPEGEFTKSLESFLKICFNKHRNEFSI